MSITLVFYVLALVCFLLAAANFPERLSLGWLGLAFCVMTQIVGRN